MFETSSPAKGCDQTEEIVDFIINLPLFEFLEHHELEVVAEHMRCVELAAGQVLFNEWDKADYVCFIQSGELDVTKKTGPRAREVMATLRRGRSIGEMSIINNFPRASTVIARTDVRLAVFPQQAFETILANHAAIGINILKGLANLLSINLKKTSSRLADNMLPMG